MGRFARPAPLAASANPRSTVEPVVPVAAVQVRPVPNATVGPDRAEEPVAAVVVVAAIVLVPGAPVIPVDGCGSAPARCHLPHAAIVCIRIGHGVATCHRGVRERPQRHARGEADGCDQQPLTSDDADARNRLTAPWLSKEPQM